jgi:hypothetical protein
MELSIPSLEVTLTKRPKEESLGVSTKKLANQLKIVS